MDRHLAAITFFLELEAGTSGCLLNTEQFPMRNAWQVFIQRKQNNMYLSF